jgi:hypothetical protein
VARSVGAQGRTRRRLFLRPRPGSGEDAIPPEAEVEAEPWGRARRRPPSEAEVEAEPWVGRGGDLLPRPRPKVGETELPVAPEAELVSLTLAGGTTVGAGRAALFSRQVGQ